MIKSGDAATSRSGDVEVSVGLSGELWEDAP